MGDSEAQSTKADGTCLELMKPMHEGGMRPGYWSCQQGAIRDSLNTHDYESVKWCPLEGFQFIIVLFHHPFPPYPVNA